MGFLNKTVLLVFMLLWPLNAFAQDGIYLKFGLTHWQRNIFSQDLIKWQGNVFDSDYGLFSLNIEFEKYFKKNHFLLSGWSIGYREDDVVFNAKTFKIFELKLFELKTGVGIEIGQTSLNFDKAIFNYGENDSITYRHIYEDGSFYPFSELSILKRQKMFLIEGGIRINIIQFGVDDYEIVNDKIKYDFNNKPMVAPYLFINIGIKIK